MATLPRHTRGARSGGSPLAPRPREVAFAGSDEALVGALLRRQSGALTAFHDRFAPRVTRVLARILGAGPDLADLRHDVFVRALSSLHRLREPSAVSNASRATACAPRSRSTA